MAGNYYNRRRAVGQFKSITSHIAAGLNEYGSPVKISENHLSGCYEARPLASRDGVLMGVPFFNTTNPYGAYGTGSGAVVDALSDNGTKDYVHIITEDVGSANDGTIDDWHVVNLTDGSLTTYDISSYALAKTAVAGGGYSGYPSMCKLMTEAFRYICFSLSTVKKLLIYDYTRFRAVTLPFYPKALTTHYNRIFAVDTGNTLWWCRAGDPFSWYGLEEDDDKIVTSTNMLDSGTYTIAAQPDVPRPLSITVTTVSTADTKGTLAVVGTDSLGAAQTKTYTPIVGKYVTPDTWASITSITASGHTASGTVDTIKIGIAPVTGFVQADAGYWCIEQERTLIGLVSLGGNLYIGAETNIYVFQGYSHDTFSLTKYVSGVGNIGGGCVENGVAYFWCNNDLYEFNGRDYPRVISRSVYVNGSVANGIYGGIDGNQGYLASDGQYLYVYYGNFVDNSNVSDTQTLFQYYYYAFDLKSRTWWKRIGVPYVALKNSYTYVKYLRHEGYFSMFTIGWSFLPPGNATWRFWQIMGSSWDCKTFIVTKAFNEGVTEDLSLTEINILCRSYYAPYDDDDEEDYLRVYYSTSSWSDPYDFSPAIVNDWTLLKTWNPSEIPEELTALSIPLAGSEIARQKCYMLKIEWQSPNDLEVYGIERRYRVLGRSR